MNSKNTHSFVWAWFGLWGITFITEFEYFFFIQKTGVELSLVVDLLFGQLGNIVVSGALASVLLWRVTESGICRFISIVSLSIASLYIVFEQIFYKLFAGHFSLSHFESTNVQDTLRIWDSFSREIDGFVWFNVLFVVVWFSVLAFRMHSRILEGAKFSRTAMYGLIVFMVISGGYDIIQSNDQMSRHPILALFDHEESEEVLVEDPSLDLYSLRYGTGLVNTVQDDSFQFDERSNVVFVVLESVGSQRIIRDGKIRRDVFPNLSAFEGSTLIFDNITNIFPGTTRSHIPLNTGGCVFTWGSVNDELEYRYNGDTLSSVFSGVGYATGLFSAMYLDFENLDQFYKNLDFDYIYDPGDFDIPETAKIHSWGVNESYVIPKVFDWIDGVDGKSFYLNFLTNTTHHPYGAPSDYNSPFDGEDRLAQYNTALHYTDSIIGELIDGLVDRGLDQNTVLVLCGDHGQAFSEKHAGNFTHRNFIYEENIQNFLLVVDLSKRLKGRVVQRRGWIGDVMPTILGRTCRVELTVPGADLYSSNYKEKIVYFHKNATPELWGLRDGNWKFIAKRMGDRAVELYDLNSDPDEQVNLASKYSDRIQVYTELVRNWYMRSNREYTSRLEGYKSNDLKRIRMEELSIPGPKTIAVGWNDDDGKFQAHKRFHPNEDLSVFTFGVSFEEDRLLTYDFFDPEGEVYSITFTHKEGWSSVYLTFTREFPMKVGEWRVVVRDENTSFVETHFNVSEDEALNVDCFIKKEGGPKYLKFGVYDDEMSFVELDVIHPMTKNLLAYAWGEPMGWTEDLKYVWESPSGKIESFMFKWKSGWDKAWVFNDSDLPMEVGEWGLSIYMPGESEPLITGTFMVSLDAERVVGNR